METVFNDLPLTLELLFQFYSLQLLCLKKGFHPHKKYAILISQDTLVPNAFSC